LVGIWTIAGLFLFFIGAFLALTPIGVSVLFVLILLLFGMVKLIAKVAPGAPWWVKGVFLIAIAQMVLNVGFSSIYLGSGGLPIPISDLMLVVALFASFMHVVIYAKKIRLPLGMWIFLGWVILNISIHMHGDYQAFGMAAARDGIRLIESLYIIPAYVAVTLAFSAGKVGENWLRSMLYIMAISIGVYGLCYPFESTIMKVSPGFSSWQKWVPIFGNFITWPMAGLISVFGVLLWRWAYPGKLLLRQRFAMILIIFSGLLVFAMLQSRASYVFIILATGLLIVIGGQGRQLSFLMGFVALCAVVLFAFEISGLEFKGRVGKLTLSGISDHVLTLSGQSSNADFNGAAAGISQRKAWRAYSLGLWSHSIETQILGVGFGRTLTDLGFIGENGEKLLVQDPHNSYVTILTRSGLLGLSMMLSMFVWVFYMAIVGYRRLRNKHRPAAAFFLCVALFHLYCMINAWGEPHFEVTHYIITAFFTYGVTWAVWDKFFNAKKPAS
jgi:hypothetical protein